MKYIINVNKKFEYALLEQDGKLSTEGHEVEIDQVEQAPGLMHILYKNNSYTAELVSMDKGAKTCRVKVNGHAYEVSVKDQFDELLHQLGMDNLNAAKVNEIKAPMPGLVLKVLVQEGQQVSKGEGLLILEAMKMENIIKSPGDALIKKIRVVSSDKVEKNQVLIELS